MVAGWEYDSVVRRLIPGTVAAFAFSTLMLCVPVATAQVHGATTSTGSSGHFNHAPATSLGSRGYLGPTHGLKGAAPINRNPVHFPNRPQRGPFSHRGEIYAVPYPFYIVDPSYSDAAQEPEPQAEEDYPAGPTIFDRRASGQSSYAAEAAYADHNAEEPEPSAANQGEEPAPFADQPQTVLVFKDGHELEVQNYAIVGSMVFDMTPGRRNKIAISDLDLTATAKQNDERGIDFQLPARLDSN